MKVLGVKEEGVSPEPARHVEVLDTAELRLKRLIKKLAISFAGIAAAFLIFSGLLMWFAANMVDKTTSDQVQTNIEGQLDKNALRLGTVIKEFAWWNTALVNIVLQRNEQWLKDNLREYLVEGYGLQELLVLDVEGSALYAEKQGKEVAAGELLGFVPSQLSPLIAQAQEAPMDEPEPVVGYVKRNGQLFRLAVCAITSDITTDAPLARRARPTMIFIDDFDGESAAIARELGLARLDWSLNEPNKGGEANTILLRSFDGQHLGSLTWSVELPGQVMLKRALYWLSPLLLIFIYVGLGVNRWFQQSFSDLEKINLDSVLLQESQRHFQSVADDAPVLIWETDADAKIAYANRSFRELLGQSPSYRKPMDLFGLACESDAAELKAFFLRILESETTLSSELHVRGLDGSTLLLSIVGTPHRVSRNQEKRFIFSAVDISIRKEMEEKAWHQANYDSLTELPNRNLLQNRLEQELKLAERSHTRLAVLFVDLDNFKNINDSLGHGAGDGVLQQASARIVSCVRDTDTVARMGGDEFVLLLPQASDAAPFDEVCHRIIDALSKPFTLNLSEAYLSASIGVALYPTDGKAGDTLMMNADAAMYQAKRSGKNQYSYYAPAMNAKLKESMQMEVDMHRALQNKEFFLQYQPILELKTKRVVGAEALVRWRKEDGTIVPPDQFIPLAEQTGMIKELGDLVLVEACRQMQQWQAHGLNLYVSVNVSSVQLRDRSLLQRIDEILSLYALSPNQLQVELTEQLLIGDDEWVTDVLTGLAQKGIKLAVDDFGTGYSALNYLQKYSVDVLKIDQAFVREIPENENDMSLVRAIIAMAKSMQLTVVAEGVETEDQHSFLVSEMCDRAQGYLYDRPLDADKFLAAIEKV